MSSPRETSDVNTNQLQDQSKGSADKLPDGNAGNGSENSLKAPNPSNIGSHSQPVPVEPLPKTSLDILIDISRHLDSIDLRLRHSISSYAAITSPLVNLNNFGQNLQMIDKSKDNIENIKVQTEGKTEEKREFFKNKLCQTSMKFDETTPQLLFTRTINRKAKLLDITRENIKELYTRNN